jgi:hypothetical protein
MPRCRHGVVSRRARVAGGAITGSFDSIGTVVFDADLNVRRSAASITPRHARRTTWGNCVRAAGDLSLIADMSARTTARRCET